MSALIANPKSSAVGHWLAPLRQLGTKWFAQGHLNNSWGGITFSHPRLVSWEGIWRSVTCRHLSPLCTCVSVIVSDKMMLNFILKVFMILEMTYKWKKPVWSPALSMAYVELLYFGEKPHLNMNPLPVLAHSLQLMLPPLHHYDYKEWPH